ncbi:hypothetical protein PanWU01x14_284230 [Parasponia andersonii]|uniref:Uncharacterized protein n=1 Tax=Parasponia andersonii TaxID=3476 RepID=A0A2P5B044_PARAD|nr:hypothetical protein PanWU01x14_284230 [Parasponia andersonii]
MDTAETFMDTAESVRFVETTQHYGRQGIVKKIYGGIMLFIYVFGYNENEAKNYGYSAAKPELRVERQVVYVFSSTQCRR